MQLIDAKTRKEYQASGIYTWRNKTTGRVYVGQAKNIHKRRLQELRALRKEVFNKKTINGHLWNSWKKYGEDMFEFSVIEKVAQENLLEREIFFYRLYKKKPPGVYNDREPIPPSNFVPNQTSFALGHTPWHKGKTGVYSKEVLEQMSFVKKGKPAWSKGLKMTEEFCKTIKEANALRMKTVERIDPKTGEIVEYRCLHDAERDGFARNCIRACSRGTAKTHGGFFWRISE